MVSVSHRKGLLALSPMLVLIILMVGLSLYFHDFYKVPPTIVFIFTSTYALLTMRGLKLNKRIAVFSKGAGDSDLMLMVWIFVLAGAFAASAKAMGAVDATVNLTLSILPESMLLPGIFAAAVLSLLNHTLLKSSAGSIFPQALLHGASLQRAQLIISER